ncbi:lipocalin-like domain-containing protein [Microbulbifer halophilus]|uniref:Lipocalin-like domain-containing protein n=1 Tax=Microbulbifer halophilus TaxID=453963 RepID=A0ABW5EHT0_9GAMM|nr:lipocalin-like domain-containing protein [Microbulbifer halophilus]MCW8128260.1 carotenoid 1,2-hydratase [Microbulbifer halophilus]
MNKAGSAKRFFLCSVLLSVPLVLFAVLALRQCGSEPADDSFAGLGRQSEGYSRARPGAALRFPEDHGTHPDYRIEWWYLTANLEDADGTPLGIQWTLFRQALSPPDDDGEDGGSPWASRQIWMAHAALSTPDAHFVAERFARDMALPDRRGQAGVEVEPFAAWLDHWRMENPAGGGLARLQVTAQGSDAGRHFGYRLALEADGPLVLHGESGFSQKSADGGGSHYYSQPFYRVEGQVEIDGQTRAVSGRAWLDREWSSQLLAPDQRGWDWFSLHLSGGAKLMAFRLRGGGGEGDDYLSGSWIDADGQQTPLTDDDLRLTPATYSSVAGRELPTRWRLRLPSRDLDVIVRARNADRWMDTVFPYWEGDVVVEGSHSGVGYLEMTGY